MSSVTPSGIPSDDQKITEYKKERKSDREEQSKGELESKKEKK